MPVEGDQIFPPELPPIASFYDSIIYLFFHRFKFILVWLWYLKKKNYDETIVEKGQWMVG